MIRQIRGHLRIRFNRYDSLESSEEFRGGKPSSYPQINRTMARPIQDLVEIPPDQ